MHDFAVYCCALARRRRHAALDQFDGATGVLHKTTTGSWKSTYGWTDGLSASFSEYQHVDTPGHQACDTGLIDFGGVSGWKVALETKEATFKSHGTLLAGRLVRCLGGVIDTLRLPPSLLRAIAI